MPTRRVLEKTKKTAGQIAFARRLRAARREAGLTQEEVGRALGVSRNSVTQWESGDTQPERKRVLELAVLYKRPPAYLEFGVETPAGAQGEGATQIPLVTWGQLKGRERETLVESLLGGKETIPSFAPTGPRSLAVPVRGIAMEPRFREGELVCFDPDLEVTHGRFVIAQVGPEREPVLRQYSEEGGRAYLLALNNRVANPIVEVDDAVHIIGVVFMKVEPV